MSLELGPWGRILVMAIGAAVVVFVLLLVVCFVGPGCCIHEYLHAEQDEKKRRKQLVSNCVQMNNTEVNLTDVPLHEGLIKENTNGLDKYGSSGSLIGRFHQHRDSTYSSMSGSTDRSSFRSISTVTSNELKGSLIKLSNPEITMGLQFVCPEDSENGKLIICIKELQSLPSREYSGGLEPYVVIKVIRNSWPLHRRAGTSLHTLRTRTLRHSFNPHFDQSFTLDARRSDVKDWCLRVTAYDQDKFANSTELCYMDLSLKDVNKLMTSKEEILLTCKLTPSMKEMGQILFGLSFLPTAQRLSISVIKAANLKYLEVTDSLANFSPYVRVVHINASTGRSIRRKKTGFRNGSENPQFNETLTFDLHPSQLDSSTFLILLCCKCPTQCVNLATLENPNTLKTKSLDRCIGKVAIGRAVANKKSRDHWLSVISSPRTVVSVWHTLK